MQVWNLVIGECWLADGNLQEETLVVYGTVYDSVQASGDLISINAAGKSISQIVWVTHMRYRNSLECKRKAATEEDKKATAKRRVTEEMNSLF